MGIDFTFNQETDEEVLSYKLTITSKLFEEHLDKDISKAFDLFKEMALREGAIQKRKR